MLLLVKLILSLSPELVKIASKSPRSLESSCLRPSSCLTKESVSSMRSWTLSLLGDTHNDFPTLCWRSDSLDSKSLSFSWRSRDVASVSSAFSFFSSNESFNFSSRASSLLASFSTMLFSGMPSWIPAFFKSAASSFCLSRSLSLRRISLTRSSISLGSWTWSICFSTSSKVASTSEVASEWAFFLIVSALPASLLALMSSLSLDHRSFRSFRSWSWTSLPALVMSS